MLNPSAEVIAMVLPAQAGHPRAARYRANNSKR
jgi:hypothetical protein